MNTTITRLEDKVNALLIAVALCGALGLGLSTFEGSALSRDGAVAAAASTVQQATTAATIALVASR